MKKTSFILVIIFICMTNLFAQNRILTVGKANAIMNESVLTSPNDNQITIRFDLNKLELAEVETDYGRAFITMSNKAPSMLQKGFPELFYLTATFIIPDSGGSDLEISCGKYVDFDNIEIAPSKGSLSRSINPQTVPFVKGDAYKKDEFYPGTLASLREPFILRDVRGQSVDVYPVQYNPVAKVLRVYSEITVTVNNNTKKTGENEFTGQKRHQIIDPQFNEMYNNLFINHSAVQGRSYPTGEEGELLIISHPAFMDDMKPYIDWKRTIGRKTTMVSTAETGTTADAIKTYISDYYYNPANNLAYVLLVGGSAQIRMYEYRNPYYNNPPTIATDNYYGKLAGSDNYMEVLIGRMSAENAEHVKTQVQRTIWYERDITTTDNWLSKAIGLASSEEPGRGHYGEADYEHINNIRNRLLDYGYNTVYQEYNGNCPDPDVPGTTMPNTTNVLISERFNSGVGIANYCNHGDITNWQIRDYPSPISYVYYSNLHVSALTNVGKLPYIFSVACLNGRMKGINGPNASSTCFAETWLRATQNNQPTGAVATLMSTISLSFQEPMTAQDEFVNICMDLPSPYSGTQPGIKRTFAGAAINATQKMLTIHGGDASSPPYMHHNACNFDSWTVFGDPTLMIRTKTPQTMTVTHDPTISFGANTFIVSCDVDGALVAMSYTDRNNEVHIMGTATVSGGVANLTFSPISSHPIKVTVTGRDKVTYQETIPAPCVNTFSGEIVTTDQTVIGCNNLDVQDVTVTDDAELILDAAGKVRIEKNFKIKLGSTLKIK